MDFVFFYLDAPKKVRTQRQQPRRQLCTKVTVPSYKSFGQACLLFEEKFERQRKQALPLSKACGNPKGKARGRSRRSEIPQRILTAKAKLTVKPSKMKKSKSAMQLKKVKPREVTKITILVKRLICIALFLTNKAK